MSNIAREVAEHLATSPDDRVWRRELRARLPEGVIRDRPCGGKHDSVSSNARDALRAFERQGWIARDAEAVQILDRMALWEFSQE
jgi:hypothetical protein